jgi:creatinine amidohydrolase/Fe(II)-dependent formamide hydrolase-like protein
VRDPGDGVGSLSASGVIGDPTRATAAKGEAILAAMAADVAHFCADWP